LKDVHEALELGFMKLMYIHRELGYTHQTLLLFLQIKKSAVISSLLNLSFHSKKTVINVLHFSPPLLLHCSTNLISFLISDFFLFFF